MKTGSSLCGAANLKRGICAMMLAYGIAGGDFKKPQW